MYLALHEGSENLQENWSCELCWEYGSSLGARNSVSRFVTQHSGEPDFYCIVRHLGSFTAANWVSFDFNVSCSSCWGYSLINTLKFKKKKLSHYILWGAAFALFKKFVGSSCRKFAMFVRRPGYIPLRHTYTYSSVPGAYTKSPYQDWHDLHSWKTPAGFWSVWNTHVRFLWDELHLQKFGTMCICASRTHVEILNCTVLKTSRDDRGVNRRGTLLLDRVLVWMIINGCFCYFKQHFLILVRNPNSRIKLIQDHNVV